MQIAVLPDELIIQRIQVPARLAVLRLRPHLVLIQRRIATVQHRHVALSRVLPLRSLRARRLLLRIPGDSIAARILNSNRHRLCIRCSVLGGISAKFKQPRVAVLLHVLAQHLAQLLSDALHPVPMQIHQRPLSVGIRAHRPRRSNHMVLLLLEVLHRRTPRHLGCIHQHLLLFRQRPSLRVLLQHNQIRPDLRPILLKQIIRQSIRPDEPALLQRIAHLLRVMVQPVARNDIRQQTALSQRVQPLQHEVPVNHPRRILSHLQCRIAIRIIEHRDIPKRHIRTHQVIHPQLLVREVLEPVDADVSCHALQLCRICSL